MRWGILLTLLILLTACSTPVRVKITGTPVVELQQPVESARYGFLMVTLNPIENAKVYIRDVQVYNGKEWLSLASTLTANSDKPVLLAQKKLLNNNYKYLKFVIDSAKFNGKSAITELPHITLPVEFELSNDFTILNLELLREESLKKSGDDLFFTPKFRIKIQNAVNVEVTSNNEVKTYDVTTIKTVKAEVSEKINQKKSKKKKIDTLSLLEENPRGLQIDYNEYLTSDLINPSFETRKILLFDNYLNPRKIVLEKDKSYNLLFENKWKKPLGIELPDFNKKILVNPSKKVNLMLTPEKTGSFEIKCVYPCWQNEGKNLAIIIVEKKKKLFRYPD